MDLEFETTISDIQVFNLKKVLGISKSCEMVDIEHEKTATVQYSLEIEARSYGIKVIYVTIKRVKVSIKWSANTDDLTGDELSALLAVGEKESSDTIVGYKDIDTYAEQGCEVVDTLTFGKDGSINVGEVEIDLDTKVIIITNEHN